MAINMAYIYHIITFFWREWTHTPSFDQKSAICLHFTFTVQKIITLVIGYQLGLQSLLWPILLANRYFTAFDLSRNSKIYIIDMGYHGEIFFKHFLILIMSYIFFCCEISG